MRRPDRRDDADNPEAFRGVWLGLLLSGAAWVAVGVGLWRWWS